MGDIQEIGKTFVQYYYSTFDSNRSTLSPLYRDHSMLTFEGQQYQGAKAIVEKLVALPFSAVQHKITTVDVQPSNPSPGPLLVTVTGQLLVDAEQNAQQFSQTFQLVPDQGSYYVFNDMFRLNYG